MVPSHLAFAVCCLGLECPFLPFPVADSPSPFKTQLKYQLLGEVFVPQVVRCLFQAPIRSCAYFHPSSDCILLKWDFHFSSLRDRVLPWGYRWCLIHCCTPALSTIPSRVGTQSIIFYIYERERERDFLRGGGGRAQL